MLTVYGTCAWIAEPACLIAHGLFERKMTPIDALVELVVVNSHIQHYIGYCNIMWTSSLVIHLSINIKIVSLDNCISLYVLIARVV